MRDFIISGFGLLGIVFGRLGFLSSSGSGGGVPSNAITTDAGDPITTDAGDYITTGS